MDEFVEAVTKEGVDGMTAKQMYRSGISLSLVKRAGEIGLTAKSLSELYGELGPTLGVVLCAVFAKIK